MTNEIALLPPRETAIEVFSSHNGLDPFLAKIREEIDTFIPCVSTRKGRDAIASMAYKVSQSKAALDKLGKELVDELKEKPKLIDAERKRVRDLLDQWRDEVRLPLTKFEEAEEARIAGHKLQIELIDQSAQMLSELSSESIAEKIAVLSALVIDEKLEEFESDAHRAKTNALAVLNSAYSAKVIQEKEKAELERLRKEAAEREQKEREARIAREAAERAQREAEAKAQAEREAAIKRESEAKAESERRELELKLQSERAEREKVEAQQREQAAREQARIDMAKAEEKARNAEIDRQRRHQEAERIEQEKREANRRHCGAINRKAANALVEMGIADDMAIKIIKAIASGKIPNVSIGY